MKELINNFKTLFTKSEQKSIVILFLGILVRGVMEVVGIATIFPFMAVVSGPEIIHNNEYLLAIYTYFDFQNNNQFLFMLGIFMIVMLVFSNAYIAFMTWRITYFSNMQGHRLSMRLLARYLEQPYTFFLNRNSADLGKNILSEVRRSITGVILPGLQALSNIIITFFVLSLLFFVNPLIATVTSLVIGVIYLTVFQLTRKFVHKIGVASTQSTLSRYKIVNEAIAGIKEVKLRGSERKLIDSFLSPSELEAHYISKSSLIALLPRYALEIVAFGGIVTIIISLIAKGYEGTEIIPLVSLYALAGYRLMPAMQQIYHHSTTIRYNLPALNIIIEDLKNMKLSKHEPYKHDSSAIVYENRLILKEICFQYSGTKEPVFNNLNLEITPYSTVGIVGKTGSGKTTLIDLILGLINPTSGSYTIDGTVINKESLSAWQKNLSYVPQTIYLVDGTIAENIAFASLEDEIDYDRVKEVAILAELNSFVETLPEKFLTTVGERGVRLSGGQRQRIVIARALYHRPKVLILDEATSALDGITESVIVDAIHNLSHKLTIIMIAHRLSTLKECDVIHIIDKGVVIKTGSYDELIKDNTFIRKMSKLN